MRIIVGISGASGVVLGLRLLQALAEQNCETHLVMTEGAVKTIHCETDLTPEDFTRAASHSYSIKNIGAAIASGSFRTEGMAVVPCSMKTLAGLVSGYSDNLLLRAADVCLKEKRKLVLMPRELPLSALHLDNMARAAGYGCTICPPLMTFYNRPRTMEDMLNHLTGKILSLFGLEHAHYKAWTGGNDTDTV